jgi:hypothetical protein
LGCGVRPHIPRLDPLPVDNAHYADLTLPDRI